MTYYKMEVKSLLFLVLVIQIGNSQITTKPPGQSLQDVLDMLTAQIAQLMANQQACNQCSARLTNLENEARDNSARLSSMESQLQSIVGTIYEIESQNQARAIRLGTLEAAADTNRGLISTVDSDMKNIIIPNINALKVAVEKLNNVNKIWKNNFKIVNNTFTALRQKVNFRVPAIQLV